MSFKNIRLWLAIRVLMLSLIIIDKKTLEGLSLLVTLNDWIDYVNNPVIKEKPNDTLDMKVG